MYVSVFYCCVKHIYCVKNQFVMFFKGIKRAIALYLTHITVPPLRISVPLYCAFLKYLD